MIKKLFTLLLCLTLTACATDNGTNSPTGELEPNTAEGSYNNGMHYLLGRGAPQDYSKAIYWFKKSADQGSSYAENELGYLYVSGKGVPQDYKAAFNWYHKAADHGLASAQYTLGQMYLHGLGTPVDKASARLYMQKAAASGFKPAQSALGSL